MVVEPTVLSEPDPEEADSLVSSNDPDDMENEQTWPTEEEMQNNLPQKLAEDTQLPDANPGTTPRTIRRVPKGTSEYQAAWIIDGDDEELIEVPDHPEVEMEVEDSGKDVAFQDLEEEEENKQSVELPFPRFISHLNAKVRELARTTAGRAGRSRVP